MTYAVISMQTKLPVRWGVDLNEASRYCKLHKGFYFVPEVDTYTRDDIYRMVAASSCQS